MPPLGQSFFARNTITVARELVGCLLVIKDDGEEVSGRIVEVEAYEGEGDPASHAGRGRTPRSEIMFGPPGFAYIYLIYGMHHCLNFVTEEEGIPGAVLIRALEPVSGREIMAARRGLVPGQIKDRDLCTGPGRLCHALGIDRNWNELPGFSLENESERGSLGGIRVYRGDGPPGGPSATPRIGIRRARGRHHRFTDPNSDCLSG